MKAASEKVKKYKFPCGCFFDIMGPSPNKGEIPALRLDIESIDFNCPAVWEMITEGRTKGMFQLESNLCKHWCKEIKPENILELAAIISLVRPGCLKAVVDGKSMTQHFADRKSGKEEVPAFDPLVDKILEDTFNVLVYQEQSMKLAEAVAGFNLQEADSLRKAIGKKIAEEMAKVKKLFLEKAKTAGLISEEQAAELFAQIEKSQRYAFNKSHAVGYAVLAYWTAYCKAHFPVQFYTKWLSMAKDKIDPKEEVRELVNDAKLADIEVIGPDIRNLEQFFYTDGVKVYFGLGSIKGIGNSVIEKIRFVVKNEVEAKIGSIESWSWFQFLTDFSRRISTTAVKALINAGAVSHYGVSRNRMLFEFDKWCELSEKEQDWIIEQPDFPDLISALRAVAKPKKEGGGAANKNRIAKILDLCKLLDNPPYSLDDRPDRVAFEEEQLMGISLSFSQIDACDTRQANCSCKEFVDGRNGEYLLIACQIERLREVTTKAGKDPGRKMAFATIKDGTCSMDNVVIFPEPYEEFGTELVEGNTVLVQGERDKKKGGFVVKKVWPL